MPHFDPLILAVLVIGLGFDFVNGFHDAANAIATIVATRVLSPRRAVLWAGFFNFMALFLFGTAVAHTVGAGLIALDAVTPLVVLCGLLGATLWGVITWRWGLPTSSSHALLGGYAGAAMTANAMRRGWGAAGDAIIMSGWIKIILFIVIAPLIGAILGRGLMMLLRRTATHNPNSIFYRRMQLGSSAALALMHGSNDAQKTAGIIAGAMAAGHASAFHVPYWLLALCYTTMGLGTLTGGWRIVRTMGHRLARLTPQSGVAAETAAALSVMTATLAGLPVSTTHVTTGAIIGVGSVAGGRPTQWKISATIAKAWVLTIPASALMAATLFFVMKSLWVS